MSIQNTLNITAKSRRRRRNIQQEIKMEHITVLVDKHYCFLLPLQKPNPINDWSMVQRIWEDGNSLILCRFSPTGQKRANTSQGRHYSHVGRKPSGAKKAILQNHYTVRIQSWRNDGAYAKIFNLKTTIGTSFFFNSAKDSSTNLW